MELTGRVKQVDIDYVTHKPKVTIELDNQDKILTDEFTKLQSLDLIDVTIKKHSKKRSLDANAYFHVLINKLARYHNISDEDMKIKMNLSYGTIARDENGKVLGAKVPKAMDMNLFYPYARWYKDEGNLDCYLFYKRTRNLDKQEFSQLINGVKEECRDVGIDTVSDAEMERIVESYFNKKDKNAQ